jgi:hypothetical protein
LRKLPISSAQSIKRFAQPEQVLNAIKRRLRVADFGVILSGAKNLALRKIRSAELTAEAFAVLGMTTATLDLQAL